MVSEQGGLRARADQFRRLCRFCPPYSKYRRLGIGLKVKTGRGMSIDERKHTRDLRYEQKSVTLIEKCNIQGPISA